MGNTIVRNRAKVMKISGEILRIKTPKLASDVIKDYPDHVLLESRSVKKYGVRASPLGPDQELKPNKIYFLLELPQFPDKAADPRRTRSDVTAVGAKDRLECLMLSRRSGSDLSSVPRAGPVQVKMRLPRAELEKLIKESKDESEVAERIVNLCAKDLR